MVAFDLLLLPRPRRFGAASIHPAWGAVRGRHLPPRATPRRAGRRVGVAAGEEECCVHAGAGFGRCHGGAAIARGGVVAEQAVVAELEAVAHLLFFLDLAFLPRPPPHCSLRLGSSSAAAASPSSRSPVRPRADGGGAVRQGTARRSPFSSFCFNFFVLIFCSCLRLFLHRRIWSSAPVRLSSSPSPQGSPGAAGPRARTAVVFAVDLRFTCAAELGLVCAVDSKLVSRGQGRWRQVWQMRGGGYRMASGVAEEAMRCCLAWWAHLPAHGAREGRRAGRSVATRLTLMFC